MQPIADLRGAEAAQLTKPEKMLRCKLASLLRVMDTFGWAQGVCNHATVSDAGTGDRCEVGGRSGGGLWEVCEDL